ncbi:MAG: RHS repeat-associated core domain-containing protein, partial [Gemmatimonadaceae bacterium]|nr:RHS repeat-associated core domain-containing protein [Gemmatimonadaceae bacterium]
VQRASYNALGAVVVSDDGAYSSRQEEFLVDGLGNRKQVKRLNSRANTHSDYNRIRLNTYDSNGRLTATVDSASIPANTNEYSLSRSVTYDNAGNVRYRLETEYDSQLGNYWGSDYVASFYGANDQLRVVNRHRGVSAHSTDSLPGARGVWEEYRYDALGRRVATRSVRDSFCPSSATECRSYIERTVWDGSQLLYEMRTPDSLPNTDYTTAGTLNAYGAVIYLHGPGTDQPLTVTRIGLSGYSEYAVAPYADIQGVYKGASTMSGADQATCAAGLTCPGIDWPWGQQTMDGLATLSSERTTWWGSLLQGTDGSGLKYQRNRFYDPATGQFTQSDPIGLAGGANLYAFASGDPVNFRDPFGLCPKGVATCSLLEEFVHWLAPKSRSANSIASAVTKLAGKLDAMVNSCGTGMTCGVVPLAGVLSSPGPIVQAAAAGSGNFGLGVASAEVAAAAGEAWVGRGARLASDGKTMISSDGLRQYRPPSFKPSWNQVQANFQSRAVAKGPWDNNGHLTILIQQRQP